MHLRKLLYSILSIMLISGCNINSDSKTIKLGHGLDTSHPVHKSMVYFGEQLEIKSGGKMKLEMYPNQQLGTERQLLELLQIGSLDMTKVSIGVLESFSPDMKVFGTPFLFRDKAHSFQILDGEIGDELLAGTEKYWLKGLGYYDAGSRSFYMKEKPIQTPKDLEGLKVRVMESETAINMVKQLGGAPTPIAWGELYTALQQGVVDGAENNLTSFYLSRHYEICKYYSFDEHTVIPDVLLMSTHFWNDLNEEEQKWVQEAADESIIFQRKLWEESEKNAMAELEKAGVIFNSPDKSLFADKISSQGNGGDNGKSIDLLIERIKRTQ